MTWKSHIAIATATAIPFNTLYVPFAVLGATAPDWVEWIINFLGYRVEHRRETHYLIIPITLILIGVFLSDLILWFGIGYLTHWLADSLTITGVPISPQSKYRVHFFGGKIRTGDTIEYIISFSFLAFVLLIVQPSLQKITTLINSTTESTKTYQKALEFNPYYIDYSELNKKKIIDNKTMKENRFKLF